MLSSTSAAGTGRPGGAGCPAKDTISKITMYVRMEGLPPFALTVSNKLLPEHLESIARNYSREQLGVKATSTSRYVLVRRCVFSNKDQLLDFKLLPLPKASSSASAPAAAASPAGGAGQEGGWRSGSVMSNSTTSPEYYYNRNSNSLQSQAGSRSVSAAPTGGDPHAGQHAGDAAQSDSPRFTGKSFAFVEVSPVYGTATPSVDDVRKQFQVTDPGSTLQMSPLVHQISIVSLHRLVLLATDPYMDSLIGNVLLLTYRQYATVDEVLERVLERFDVPPLVKPGQPDRSALDKEFYAELQRRIQCRVFALLEQWVEQYSSDFADPNTFRRLKQWATQKADKAAAPTRLLHLLDSVDCSPLHARKALLLPGVPRRGTTPTSVLVRYTPADIAAQLTILTQCVHSRLTPAELVGRRWETDEAAMIPNFIAYRDFFARVGNWCTYAVVSERDLERRALNLDAMLFVCDELTKLRNWDMLVAVYGGLTDSAVVRLKRTWRSLQTDAIALSEKLQELLAASGSYRVLKDVMQRSPRPQFPCIATFFKELRTLEDEPVSRQGQVNYMRCLKQYQLIMNLLSGKDSNMDALEPISELQGAFSFWREVDNKTLMGASQDLE